MLAVAGGRPSRARKTCEPREAIRMLKASRCKGDSGENGDAGSGGWETVSGEEDG